MRALTIDSGMTNIADSMSLRASETRKKLNMLRSLLSYLTARQTSTLPPIAMTTMTNSNRTGQLYASLPVAPRTPFPVGLKVTFSSAGGVSSTTERNDSTSVRFFIRSVMASIEVRGGWGNGRQWRDEAAGRL